jgi:hypothetical protein
MKYRNLGIEKETDYLVDLKLKLLKGISEVNKVKKMEY